MVFIISISATVFFLLQKLNDNIEYFYYPYELNSLSNINYNKNMRVGGLVVANSIKKHEESISFYITDESDSKLEVIYNGKSIPILFKENNGVIMEGKLQINNNLNSNKIENYTFVATKLLTKHNEFYYKQKPKNISTDKNY